MISSSPAIRASAHPHHLHQGPSLASRYLMYSHQMKIPAYASHVPARSFPAVRASTVLRRAEQTSPFTKLFNKRMYWLLGIYSSRLLHSQLSLLELFRPL